MKYALILITLLICQDAIAQTLTIYRFRVSGDVPKLKQTWKAIEDKKIEGLEIYVMKVGAKGKFKNDLRKPLKNSDPKRSIGIMFQGDVVAQNGIARLKLRYAEAVLRGNIFDRAKPLKVTPQISDSSMESVSRFDVDGSIILIFKGDFVPKDWNSSIVLLVKFEEEGSIVSL